MRQRVALGVSLILVGVLAACGGSPTTTQPTPKSAATPAAPKIVLTSIRVDGPATLAPGTSAQYKATALYTDGSSVDVTSQSTWSSKNDAIVSVTATGLMTARSTGEVEVTIAFGTSLAQGQRDILVVPVGFYKVSVSATEDLANVHLDNVRVQVVSGPAAGLAATTDWYGNAVLIGVPQDAQLSFTKDGYQPLVQSVHLESNSSLIFAQLIPSGGRANFVGQYQLTINGSNCAGDGAFPEAAKTRTYAASIQNSPTQSFGLIVHLSGSNFAIGATCPICGGETSGNGFGGQAEAAEGRFTLTAYAAPEDWNDGVYPDVVEALADGRFLTISGQAIVTPTPNGFAGTLDGAFAIYTDLVTGGSGGSQAVATCRSSALPFSLVRQAGTVK